MPGADNYRVITSHTRLQQCRLARARCFVNYDENCEGGPGVGDADAQRLQCDVADPRQLPERPVTPKHPGFHRAEHRRGDASCGDGDVQSGIGCTRDIAVTSPQLGLDGIGEVGFHLAHMADDPARLQLAAPQRRNLRHCVNVIRKREDSRLHGIDDRFVGRSSIQRRAKPVQSGVVVGKQQIVLGSEVAIESTQRHPGVLRNLLG